MNNQLSQVIQQLAESQQQTNKQMLVMLSLMRQQMNTDIDVISSQLELNLQGFETSLNTIVADYADKRKQLLEETLRQLENANSWQFSDLINSNNGSQKLAAK
jgi:hypothetical protein